jgi:hypothetical protein
MSIGHDPKLLSHAERVRALQLLNDLHDLTNKRVPSTFNNRLRRFRQYLSTGVAPVPEGRAGRFANDVEHGFLKRREMRTVFGEPQL